MAQDTINVSVVPCQSWSQLRDSRDPDAAKDLSSSHSFVSSSHQIDANCTLVNEGEHAMDLGQAAGFSTGATSPRGDHSYSSALAILSASTQCYLSQLFWTTYNETFPFINKDLFSQSKAQNNTEYYSKSLEICIWLAGVRFANRDRADIAMLFVPHTDECKLHRLAKEAVEADMETLTSLPLIQAFLLLADIEASLGHYSAGWMYIGESGR